MEDGISGTHSHIHNHGITKISMLAVRINGAIQHRTTTSSSFRNLSSCLPLPRSGRFEEEEEEDRPLHFLDACFLCKNPLACNRDIFMYRGDTPFCSEECRQEQIEIDETQEKNSSNLSSASMKAIMITRKKEQKEQSTSANKTTRNYSFRTGTVAAA